MNAPRTPSVDRGAYPYRMKDLCEATGLPRQAIHFYIQRGLLPPGEKTGRNMAFYGEEHLERLKAIKRLQHERFLPLKAIKAILDGKSQAFDPVQWRFLSEVKKSLVAAPKEGEHEAVSLDALVERYGVDRRDLEEAIEAELLGAREDERGVPCVSERGTWLVELLAQIRALGFSRELGFGVADVAFYEELVSQLFSRELELVTSRLAGLEPALAASMIDRVIPVVHSFLMKSHLSKIQEFFDGLD